MSHSLSCPFSPPLFCSDSPHFQLQRVLEADANEDGYHDDEDFEVDIPKRKHRGKGRVSDSFLIYSWSQKATRCYTQYTEAPLSICYDNIPDDRSGNKRHNLNSVAAWLMFLDQICTLSTSKIASEGSRYSWMGPSTVVDLAWACMGIFMTCNISGEIWSSVLEDFGVL